MTHSLRKPSPWRVIPPAAAGGCTSATGGVVTGCQVTCVVPCPPVKRCRRWVNEPSGKLVLVAENCGARKGYIGWERPRLEGLP
jgi:hypothetical protein